MECSECGAVNMEGSDSCRECGAGLRPSKEAGNSTIVWVVGGAVLVAFVVMLFSATGGSPGGGGAVAPGNATSTASAVATGSAGASASVGSTIPVPKK